jgi:uncharacterized membrane protein
LARPFFAFVKYNTDMNTSFWARLHGGSTHFPIGLLIASFLFDFVAYFARRDPLTRDLHAAAFYSLLLAALASSAAVFTGLMLTHWQVGGSGNLAKHHLFLWPAFALLVALAVWRLIVQGRASRIAFGIYLAVAAIASVFIAIAGYWGGEMLLKG